MKAKMLPIIVLVMFLFSMIPTALAQEETTTAADTQLETGSESELQEISSADCWADKPDYTPGVDKGFFIWQGTCGKFWWADWSGDTREKWKRWYKIIHNTEPATEEPTSEEVLAIENTAATIDTNTLTTEEVTELQSTGEITSTAETTNGATGAQIVTNLKDRIAARIETGSNTDNTITAKKAVTATKKWLVKKPKLMYKVKGTITSNGQIFDVGIRKFDRRDKIVFRPGKNVITFHGWVGPHFDGIFFRTTGDQVTFDLEFDGKKTTELVYIGKDKEHPDSNPFTLTGEPATRRVCPVNSVIYNNKCVNKIAGIAVTPEGISGDLSSTEPTEKPVAVPSVVPQEGTATARAQKIGERLATLSEKARLRWTEVNQKRIEKIANLKELKEKPEFVKFRKELNFRVRQVNIEKLKEAKQNYGQAVKNLVQAKEKSREAHQAFLTAKNELKACTENCEELEAKILQNAKDFLIRTADSMINHLEKVKTTVQGNEDLTDEEASEIITKIDAEIKELQDAKAKVEAATTKEELKEASKTILAAWKKINRYTLFHIAKIVNARHGGIIVKLKHLELRLQKVLEKMEENGKDTSTIQPLVDEFNVHLEAAKTNFDLAEQKFKEFKDLPEPKGETGNKIIQEAQGYMKEARNHLKLAQEKLKGIVKAIKDAKGNTELAETTTEEAEDTETEEQV